MSKPQEKFEIEALPENAALARERVKQAAIASGFRGFVLDDIEVATGEAVTNAILYGSPAATSRIVVVCYLTQDAGSAFHVEIHDQGQGFDPSGVRDEDDSDALGGRGIRLMRALMDEVTLHYDGQGMVVRMCKRLPL